MAVSRHLGFYRTANSDWKRLHECSISIASPKLRLTCSIRHADDFEKTKVLTWLYHNACLLVLSLAGISVNKNAIKHNRKVSALLCHPRLRFWGNFAE